MGKEAEEELDRAEKEVGEVEGPVPEIYKSDHIFDRCSYIPQ